MLHNQKINLSVIFNRCILQRFQCASNMIALQYTILYQQEEKYSMHKFLARTTTSIYIHSIHYPEGKVTHIHKHSHTSKHYESL